MVSTPVLLLLQRSIIIPSLIKIIPNIKEKYDEKAQMVSVYRTVTLDVTVL